jgi:hypothetical protein
MAPALVMDVSPTETPQARVQTMINTESRERNGTIRYTAARSLEWPTSQLTSMNAGELG